MIPDPFHFDKRIIGEVYLAVQSRLAQDPVLQALPKNPSSYLKAIEDLMRNPPADSGKFWEWLHGHEGYRYAGLMVLCEAFGGKAADATIKGDLLIPDGITFAAGNVRIEGNLVLEAQAMLVCLGTLAIEGNLLTDLYDYSLVAAREMTFVNGISGGELIALGSITASEDIYLPGNEYSCLAQRVQARNLVDFERQNTFLETDVRLRISKWDFDGAAEALGLPAEESKDLGTRFMEKLERNKLDRTA